MRQGSARFSVDTRGDGQRGARPAHSAFTQGTREVPCPLRRRPPVPLHSLICLICKTWCQVQSMSCGCLELCVEKDPVVPKGPEQNRMLGSISKVCDGPGSGKAACQPSREGVTSLGLPRCLNLGGKSSGRCLRSQCPQWKMDHWIELQEWRPSHHHLPSSTQEAP